MGRAGGEGRKGGQAVPLRQFVLHQEQRVFVLAQQFGNLAGEERHQNGGDAEADPHADQVQICSAFRMVHFEHGNRAVDAEEESEAQGGERAERPSPGFGEDDRRQGDVDEIEEAERVGRASAEHQEEA